MYAIYKRRTQYNNETPSILKIPNDCLISILQFVVDNIDINSLLNELPNCYDKTLETKVYPQIIGFLIKKINKSNLTTLFTLKLVCKKWKNLSDYINKRFGLNGKYHANEKQNSIEIIKSRLNINCNNKIFYFGFYDVNYCNKNIKIGERKFNISTRYKILPMYNESNNHAELIGVNLCENYTNKKSNDGINITIFEEYKNIKGDDILNVSAYDNYKNNNNNNKFIMLNNFKQQELKFHTIKTLHNKQKYKLTKNNKYHIQQPRQKNKY